MQSLDNQILVYQVGERFKLNKKKHFVGHTVAGYACQIGVYVCMYICIDVRVCVCIYTYIEEALHGAHCRRLRLSNRCVCARGSLCVRACVLRACCVRA